MSRYSPTVQPTGVNPLAAALAGLGEGLDEGTEIRARRHDREENDRVRRLQETASRLQLARLGAIPEGEQQPASPVVTSGEGAPFREMMPARMPHAGPSVPPPVSSSIAGSPAFQDQEPTDDIFGAMRQAGRPKPVVEPAPGSWTPEHGFYGIPTSRYAGPIVPIGSGMVYDPARSPEALAEGRAADAAAAAAKAKRGEFDYEENARRTTADNELVQTVDEHGVRHYVRRSAAVGERAPAPAEPLVEVIGKDGQRTYVPRASAAGMNAPPNAIQWGKFQTPAGPRVLTMEEGSRMGYAPLANEGGSSGFGAGGVAGAGRTLAGIAGLKTAHGKMLEFENAVLDKKATFDGLDFFKTQVGKMYDEHGFINQAAVSAALANINSKNPALGEYLQAGMLWALEESSLSNRPSDFRTKLDEFVSSLKPDAQPGAIRFMQEGRTVRVTGWENAAPAIQAMLDRAAGRKDAGSTPGAGAGGGNGATRLAVASQAEYDHLVAPKPNGAGMTDAQVAARYDVPTSIKRKTP